MEFLGEAIILGVDAIIFGVCFTEYVKNRGAIGKIKSAPYLEIHRDLKDIVQSHPNQKIPYVIIRGTVKPLGNPVISANNPQITGVVQSLSIREHVVQRSSAGFWSDQERIINESHNVTPFVLQTSGSNVEILDPLAAEILDMDVISNQFNPNQPKVMDHVWAFFVGIKQKGVQTTEKMLRTNAIITGIGELVTSSDGKRVKLQPPTNGSPYFLTTMQVSSLLRKLESSKKTYKIICVLCAMVGVFVGGIIAKGFMKKRRVKLEEMRRREELQRSRKERRKRVRDEDLPENQICVVCKVNPREIILLPCGHVCLCEDCSIDIQDYCPVCRSKIDKKSAAYIS
ncbi:mitochondrial E3 ubiquitin protein ligase 1-like [Onthophagus taurus]|uniref:mitochondrial E3 ubiquitin protein ligase 1-like n=1 Tax=Onthophagus taurus TaxID=166361 RepID=UPI000C2027A0|nr:mitochondrial E3 ubiquitin protein ligase 1-like [Onthophagus taurus]